MMAQDRPGNSALPWILLALLGGCVIGVILCIVLAIGGGLTGIALQGMGYLSTPTPISTDK